MSVDSGPKWDIYITYLSYSPGSIGKEEWKGKKNWVLGRSTEKQCLLGMT